MKHSALLTRRANVFLAAIILVSAVLLMMTGCGKLGEKYIYIEWSTSYFEKYYVRWFDDFEKLHADENVRIKFRAMPSNAAQGVYTMMISHTLSDVVALFTGTSSLLLENNALLPVPEGFIDLDDYMPTAVSWPRYPDGTLAAIPGGVGIRPFIYFDSADLREAGVTLDDMPDDYEGYGAWAQKLFKREVDGKVVLGALAPDQAARAKVLRRPLGITRGHLPSFYPFMTAYLDPMPDADGKSDNSLDDYIGGPSETGSRPFRLDSPEFIQGLTEWRKFFVPASEAIADGNTERLLGLQNDVYSGCEAGNWIFGEVYTIDMLVAPLPSPKGRIAHLYCGPGAEGVSRDSKHPELAFEFAKYITDTNQQIDGYYGHGYTVGRLSAWKQLDDDNTQDIHIRETLLRDYSDGHGDFVGQPQINRTSHDTMDVVLFVSLGSNITVVKAYSWEATPETEAPPADAAVGDIASLAERHASDAKALADKVAAASGERVTVIVQGTPPELLTLRSNIRKSPIPVYLPLLPHGVFQPNMTIWDRVTTEVLARAIQKVSSADDPETPEAVAKWAQAEAEAIVAGKK